MSFESTERIAAIDPAKVGVIFPQLVAMFGEDVADGDDIKRTIGVFWDNAAKTVTRPASLTDGTIKPTVLTDGRHAYICRWQTGLVAAWQAGQLPDVEELSAEQFAALQPT